MKEFIKDNLKIERFHIISVNIINQKFDIKIKPFKTKVF